MTASPTIDDIRADFEILDDWEDRYRYLIELGRSVPDLPERLKTDANKVRGCASQVWLATRREMGPGGVPVLHFAGESDAHIVRGLVALLLAVYSGKTTAEILAIDAQAILAGFGLREHLTPQRSNGLNSMVERIRADARAVGVA
ncbi:MAG: SufE family protein [Hyphomicrobiaceae bacterium]